MLLVRTTARAGRRRGSGATSLEYALGIAIVAVSALAATQMLGCRVNAVLNNVTHSLAKAF